MLSFSPTKLLPPELLSPRCDELRPTVRQGRGTGAEEEEEESRYGQEERRKRAGTVRRRAGTVRRRSGTVRRRSGTGRRRPGTGRGRAGGEQVRSGGGQEEIRYGQEESRYGQEESKAVGTASVKVHPAETEAELRSETQLHVTVLTRLHRGEEQQQSHWKPFITFRATSCNIKILLERTEYKYHTVWRSI